MGLLIGKSVIILFIKFLQLIKNIWLYADNGVYYWYGESKKTDSLADHGINCYSTTDKTLTKWKFEGSVRFMPINPKYFNLASKSKILLSVRINMHTNILFRC
jgi:hypothetical protein